MNLRRWLGMEQAEQYLQVVERVRETQREGVLPGVMLQADGVDQDPSPVRHDPIAESCTRLMQLHGWD